MYYVHQLGNINNLNIATKAMYLEREPLTDNHETTVRGLNGPTHENWKYNLKYSYSFHFISIQFVFVFMQPDMWSGIKMLELNGT